MANTKENVTSKTGKERMRLMFSFHVLVSSFRERGSSQRKKPQDPLRVLADDGFVLN
jgi:hypothetical protein